MVLFNTTSVVLVATEVFRAIVCPLDPSTVLSGTASAAAPTTDWLFGAMIISDAIG